MDRGRADDREPGLSVRLIDSHAHLQAAAFAAEADEVAEAARLAGVERVLVPGWEIGRASCRERV